MRPYTKAGGRYQQEIDPYKCKTGAASYRGGAGLFLGQHRTIWQEHSAKVIKGREYCMYFPLL